MAVKVRTPLTGFEKHILANVTQVSFVDSFIWTIIFIRVHHCCFWWDTPFKMTLQIFITNKRQRRFLKKNKKKHWKKGKTFHKKKNDKKKVFHKRVAVLSLPYFFMFENSMSMCHTDIFFFLFCMAVNNKLLLSTWWFSCRCCWVQVKHRMFSLRFVFFNVLCF